MQGDSIPDDDFLLRYASPNRVHRSDDGELWLRPGAFELRDGEDYLSLTWVDFFEGDHAQRIFAAVCEFSRGVTLRPKGAFGKATARAIREAGREQSPQQQLRILHEPDELNRAHASVRRYPRDNLRLLETLASGAFCVTFSAAPYVSKAEPTA